MTKKPKAIELAEELLFAGRFAHEHEDEAARRRINRNSEAAAELRRLHEVNAELLEALKRIAAPNALNADHRVEACREALREIARAAIAKAEEQA